jgi:RimJ/RimL family protein N-acetyltransferase/GNAT superfamily N-acetyltransferase
LNPVVFTPIRTRRLVIRAFTPDDVDGFHARRNEPEVARYQDWVTPYPRSESERVVAELAAMEGPTNDEWWMAVVDDGATGATLGDLALHLTDAAKTAEIGYSFGHAHWGRGYAVEALEALVAYLFDELDVTRVFGMLHPDNPASAMVMERTGFLFEGHTRSSFWLDGEVSDDWIYGLTRADWASWRNRPTWAPDDVRLVPIDVDIIRAVAGLATHKTQERFVAPMGRSFADALFPEVVDGGQLVPWLRAVEADGDIAGFVMLSVTTDHHPEPYLWRLLIDRMHQRRGIGSRAVELVADACRSMGDRALLTSWVDGKGSPRPFYERLGFVPTGRIIDGEVEARRPLD